MKLQGKDMEVKRLFYLLKVILENDQNNIEEAKFVVFVVKLSS